LYIFGYSFVSAIYAFKCNIRFSNYQVFLMVIKHFLKYSQKITVPLQTSKKYDI